MKLSYFANHNATTALKPQRNKLLKKHCPDIGIKLLALFAAFSYNKKYWVIIDTTLNEPELPQTLMRSAERMQCKQYEIYRTETT